MPSDTLKRKLKHNFGFLSKIYNAESVKALRRELNYARGKELNVLLEAIHYIISGKITISSAEFNNLVQQKVLVLLRKKLEEKESLRKLLNSHRETKVTFLKRISKSLHSLLTPFFE